ncbi:hypothetical protein [Haloarcula litorea]|uniref:hypothetical protein n=1 Tax=Haloarcula litorea TaxID=3032579 RepID=UPI0023E76A4F|nr:hypothetical protein [Halomicroarcula sp. GDY20]
MSDRDRDQPSDTMRERVSEDTRFVWFLLDADRWVVATIFSGVLFVALLVGGSLHPTPAQTLLVRGDPGETLYQALITGTITGVTLVLTLSQLVLSQELGAAGDQQDRMEGAMSFRGDVADTVDAAVSPAEPSAFLRSLVRATKEQAEDIQDTVDAEGFDDQSVEDLVSTYLDSIVGNAETVTDQLEGGSFGEFDVVKAALNYNYSWKIYAGRRITEEYGDHLSDDVRTKLDGLVETLQLFGPAREHFKTLYFQWELSNLSRTLLYVAIPALTVSIAALLFLDPRGLPGATLGVSHALLLVSLTTTIALVPFMVLLAYILRIVTITKRTLSIGPFILRDTDRSVDVSWD